MTNTNKNLLEIAKTNIQKVLDSSTDVATGPSKQSAAMQAALTEAGRYLSALQMVLEDLRNGEGNANEKIEFAEKYAKNIFNAILPFIGGATTGETNVSIDME